jgi:hypothetical protein
VVESGLGGLGLRLRLRLRLGLPARELAAGALAGWGPRGTATQAASAAGAAQHGPNTSRCLSPKPKGGRHHQYPWRSAVEPMVASRLWAGDGCDEGSWQSQRAGHSQAHSQADADAEGRRAANHLPRYGLLVGSLDSPCTLSRAATLTTSRRNGYSAVQSLGNSGGVERTGDGAHESRREDAGEGEGDAVTTERQKTALEEIDAVALVVTCLQRALATLDPDGATADLLETCALGTRGWGELGH